MYGAKKKWPNFEKKIFFPEYSRNFEIPKNFQTQFSRWSYGSILLINSSIERGKVLLPETEKKWGGGGGRKGVKFHFENMDRFFNLKNHGIS